MKHSFSLLITGFFSGYMFTCLAGCGGGTRVIQPDSDAAEEKPGPDGKKGQALAAKKKPRKDDSTVREKNGGKANGDPEGKGFHLPADRGGKLLGALLPPHRQAVPAPSDFAGGPHRSAPARFVDVPEMPLPPNRADLPGARLDPPTRTLRPRALPDDTSLTDQWPNPRLPERSDLPDAARVRLPSAKVSQPLDLALLSQAIPDRVPLTDPTVPISTAAAMAGKIPPRTTPAPFLRQNLPDPFEHRQAIRLRKQPKEDQVPIGQGSSRPVK
jgi:hypothetical protein